MREYIVAHRGSWLHFFIKPHVGLCCRRKTSFKFDEYKVILSGAAADFSVYASGDFIHIVCQDEKGSVLYLCYDGSSWKKSMLLESRSAVPYDKNFHITELSGYINLLYTLENKNRLMLVHHILISGASPEVVAYIQKDSVPFSLLLHHETSFSVFYTSEDGRACKQTFKWSQKKFAEAEFSEESMVVKFAAETGDGISRTAVKSVGGLQNLVFIQDDGNGILQESVVYSDCSRSIVPVISSYGSKQYMVWSEHGNVMSSCLQTDGKWSVPVLYAKSSKSEAKLYAICREGRYEYYYGIAHEHDITLYGTDNILKNPPSYHAKKQAAAQSPASKETESLLRTREEQLRLLCSEISEQRRRLAELSAKIDDLLGSVPLADEEDIDNVLLS